MAPADPSPAEVNQLLADERAALIELLRGVSSDEWELPTECPAWSVKGIVGHLLGDDLSILSRQRDGAPPGVAPKEAGHGAFVELDRFNEQWVDAARFISIPLLLDLLASVGAQVHEWYATVDPERFGEAVHWIGPDPAPYRVLAAREYLERWVHHQQIRRALGRPPLDDPTFTVPAVAVVMLGFPQALGLLPAPEGTSIVIALSDAGTDAVWTLSREAGTWHLVHHGEPAPTTHLSVDVGTATALFSQGLLHQDVPGRVDVTGDAELGSTLVAGIAAFFGRPRD